MTALVLIAAAVVTHTLSITRQQFPISTIANVLDVVPVKPQVMKKAKTTTDLKDLKTGPVPTTEFWKAPREEHHYKLNTKYSETIIKSDLRSNKYWLNNHFSLPSDGVIIIKYCVEQVYYELKITK